MNAAQLAKRMGQPLNPAHADEPICPIGAALVEYCLEQSDLL